MVEGTTMKALEGTPVDLAMTQEDLEVDLATALVEGSLLQQMTMKTGTKHMEDDPKLLRASRRVYLTNHHYQALYYIVCMFPVI